MEVLKLDRTKLMTVRNYADREGVAVMTVYRWIRERKVKGIIIDGIQFVYLGG